VFPLPFIAAASGIIPSTMYFFLLPSFELGGGLGSAFLCFSLSTSFYHPVGFTVFGFTPFAFVPFPPLLSDSTLFLYFSKQHSVKFFFFRTDFLLFDDFHILSPPSSFLSRFLVLFFKTPVIRLHWLFRLPASPLSVLQAILALREFLFFF